MKLDYDLVRRILLDVETSEPGSPIFGFIYEDKSEAEILQHVELLIEASILDGMVINGEMGMPARCIIRKLTWHGHQFLANARNDSVWKKVMGQIKEKSVSVGMDVLTALLKKAANDVFGLPTA